MAGVKATHRRVSFADLERWPEDGGSFTAPAASDRSARLHLALNEYAHEHGGVVLYAPLDIVLTEHDVVQPHLLLFTQATIPA